MSESTEPNPLAMHCAVAAGLTPRAARVAKRVIDTSVGIPADWRFALSVVLTERGRTARDELSLSDFALLSRAREDGLRGAADWVARSDQKEDQRQARQFLGNVLAALQARAPEATRATDAAPAERLG